MEESKDVTAWDNLSAEGEPGAESGLCATDELCAASGQCAEDKPRVEDGLRAASKQSAEDKPRVEDGLRAVSRQSAERRFRMASGLRVQDGGWMTGAHALCCDQCRKPILRLETYIAVGCVTLCDGCYMNMGTREFLSKIGGELRVME